MKGIRKASFITGGIVLVVLLLIGFRPSHRSSVRYAQRIRGEEDLKELAYIVMVYAKDHAENLPAGIGSLSGQLFESYDTTNGILRPKGDPIESFSTSDTDPEVFSRNSYIASKDGSHVIVFERPGFWPDHIVEYIELDLEGKWRCHPDFEVKQCTEQQIAGLISKLDSPPAQLSSADSLIAAAENGRIDKIETLLAHGVSIDEKDRRGWTALTAATEHDQAGAVEYLISKGAKINVRDNVGMGRTALMRACALGYTDIVDSLLADGADIEAKLDDGSTSLTEALAYPMIVQKLIAAGANINENSENQLSPLIAASSLGYAGTVGVLIDHGADLRTEGLLALEGASRTGQGQVIEVLLSKGVSADKNVLGQELSDAYCYPKALKALISAGANVNERCTCPGYRTPVMISALNGCPEAVNLLIASGAELNLKDDHGYTVLDMMLASTRTEWMPRTPDEKQRLLDIIDTLRKSGAKESGSKVEWPE